MAARSTSLAFLLKVRPAKANYGTVSLAGKTIVQFITTIYVKFTPIPDEVLPLTLVTLAT